MLLLLLCFLGGVLTILSPCILPVLPFVFARADRPFLRSGAPMLVGMTLAFAAVSTLAAVGGGWAVQANEAGRWIALVMLSLFAVALLVPKLADLAAQPLVALGGRLSNATAAEATVGQSLLLGIATGLVWAPCAGPILGLILTTAALNGPKVGTTALLFAYALGAALSLAGVLLVGRRAIVFLSRHRGAEAWVRRGLGVAVLVGVAAIALGFDRGVLTRLSGPGTTAVESGLIARLAPSKAPRGVDPENLADFGDAPSLEGATAWLNGPPLTNAGLKGKVVLVDFWTYSCINCLRAMPYVKAWAARYEPQGLTVVGVHTPEFAFEKQRSNVERAVRDFGIRYPVAMDNDYAIWRAFKNGSWPSHYFIDAQGHVRYVHHGEGEYDKSEAVIRALLAERNGAPVTGALVGAAGSGVQAAADFPNRLSPETYVGYSRAEGFSSPGGAMKDQEADYRLPAAYAADKWGLSGRWRIGGEQATALDAGGKIAFQFRARDLHMVLGPAAEGGAPIRFRITLDGKPPGGDHGLNVDAEGYGAVTGQKLYQLVRQRKVQTEDRLFQIEFLGPGVQAYAFTFG